MQITNNALPHKKYVIMEGPKSRTSLTPQSSIEDLGIKTQEKFEALNAATAELSQKDVLKLQQNGYAVYEDKEFTVDPPNPNLGETVKEELKANGPQRGFGETQPPEYFKERPVQTEPRFNGELAQQYTGKGVTIAILDTGLHASHPDMADKILANVDFTNSASGADDLNGHGSHCGTISAGSGKVNGTYRGQAPDANLVGLKVLGDNGSGSLSGIISALNWAIENKDKYNIRVLNMSLGAASRGRWDNNPLNKAVLKAWDSGIVVCAAGGNEGPKDRTIGMPGNVPDIITVGAADDRNTADRSDDKLADFSSRGPTWDGITKPDLVAPGVAIIAGNVQDSEIDKATKGIFFKKRAFIAFAKNHEGFKNTPNEMLEKAGFPKTYIGRMKEDPTFFNRVNEIMINKLDQYAPEDSNVYVAIPGTSMATPMVAGIVAKLVEANPEITPSEVKQVLVETAKSLPGDYAKNEQGAGMVDVEAALAKVLASKQDPSAALIAG